MKSIVNSIAAKAIAVGVVAAVAAAPFSALAQRGQGGGQGQGRNPFRNVPISGTFATPAAPNDTTPFNGRLDITGFQVIDGRLFAIGNLTARAGDQRIEKFGLVFPVADPLFLRPGPAPRGNQGPGGGGNSGPGGGFGARSTQLDVRPAAFQTSFDSSVGPLVVPAQTTEVCPILNLVLGPLDLDLLGLVIHLDQVVLDITAVAGPGNLLGNLLCALVGLLDPAGTPTPVPALDLAAVLQAIANLLNAIAGAL